MRIDQSSPSPTCAAVIGGCNCSKALLSGSVPDLELDDLFLNLDGSKAKVDSDGANVGLGKGVVLRVERKEL